MIVFTNFIPREFDALTLWPFIFVRPLCRSNRSLIEHELVHYHEQAWITPIWIARYLLSRKFRMEAEIRAYTRQIELGGITRKEAAEKLMRYKLNITFEQAQRSI